MGARISWPGSEGWENFGATTREREGHDAPHDLGCQACNHNMLRFFSRALAICGFYQLLAARRWPLAAARWPLAKAVLVAGYPDSVARAKAQQVAIKNRPDFDRNSTVNVARTLL
jgi:hypothetical protein